MAKKGSRSHLKRFPAPKHWPIHRKEEKFTVRPRPGPHSINRCLPLLIIIRDILHLALSYREAKRIISEKKILVDGKVRTDIKFPAGLMDVISISDIDQHYRLIPVPRKGLIFHPIDAEEKSFKLCRINNKNTVRGGATQINLHDGRNILINMEDLDQPIGDIYDTINVLKITIPEQEILDHIKFEEGNLALAIEGKNMGYVGTITNIERRLARENVVTFEGKDGEIFQTAQKYVFPIGRDSSLISLPE